MVNLNFVHAGTILPNLIFGLMAVVLGMLTIRYRRRLNDAVYKNQKAMFGQRAAQASAGRQTPFTMGVVGAGIILVGLVMLAFAMTGIVQNFL
ncbi:hypothetical protein LJR042_000134 [Microbacterium maritypicum]|uniref:hypothetical protein n=1 Tax=Microbacterium TaxID=33882 RepID=UPI00142384E7|nr:MULTISPECIES: hypothetical protein [Microbacterium]NIG66680.1 hypothetical protein [Microbacterium sp. Be9]